MVTPIRIDPESAARRAAATVGCSIWNSVARKCWPSSTRSNPRSRASRTCSTVSRQRSAADSWGGCWFVTKSPNWVVMARILLQPNPARHDRRGQLTREEDSMDSTTRRDLLQPRTFGEMTYVLPRRRSSTSLGSSSSRRVTSITRSAAGPTSATSICFSKICRPSCRDVPHPGESAQNTLGASRSRCGIHGAAGRAAIRIRSLMCYHVLHEESSTRSRRP